MRLISGLDFETTGFVDTGDHRVIEVYAGLWDLDTHARVDSFYSLVHPNRSIPADATRVHGITLADLHGAPTFSMIAEDLMAFLRRGAAMIAHNGISFDGPFLDQELARLGMAPHGLEIVDTMTDARWATPDGKSPTLGELCFAMGIPYDATKGHAAEYDVEVMMRCYFTGVRWGMFQRIEEIARAA